MNKILIVEDDNTIHDMVKEYLNKRGFQCEHAYSGTEALLVQKQRKLRFDLDGFDASGS